MKSLFNLTSERMITQAYNIESLIPSVIAEKHTQILREFKITGKISMIGTNKKAIIMRNKEPI
jgi:hypothetical protein